MATQSTKAELRDLVYELKEVDWKQLGIQLSVPTHILTNIDRENPGNESRKLSAVLQYCIDNETASWEKIVEALQRIGGHGNIITNIQSKYMFSPPSPIDCPSAPSDSDIEHPIVSRLSAMAIGGVSLSVSARPIHSLEEQLSKFHTISAKRLRKVRASATSGGEPSGPEVSVENAKTKRKKCKFYPKDSTKSDSDVLDVSLFNFSSEDEDEIKVVRIDSKSASIGGSTSSRTLTNSLNFRSRPSTSSSSLLSLLGKQQASTSKSTAADSDASSSSTSRLESDYLAALRLNQAKPTTNSDNNDKDDVTSLDAALAKSLQEMEYGIFNPKKDVSFVVELRVVKPGPSSSLDIIPSSDVVHSHEIIPTPLKATDSSKVNPLLRKHPTCWTECPKCPADAVRKYHLIDVMRDSAEWYVIARPITEAGFDVTRVRRIQNEMFWQRLCFEKQLMLRERADVNERFLYHTSRSQVSVICEEGLDQRLITSSGNFGSGIYFSDDPVKCDRYSTNFSSCKIMFCCRVLLGHTKIYPKGVSDRLVREPLKENPLPGEPKAYDSVQGNLSGQNEFVVYNMYRVMPEYVIEYRGNQYAAGLRNLKKTWAKKKDNHH